MTASVFFHLLFTIVCFANADTVRTVHSPEFLRAIESNRSKVQEFEFLRAEGEKLGVRVFLFGGTASAFAHYVKWDLMRQKGDNRFQGDRFDYDYTNIFRSNQDLDIVVDGPSEKAKELEKILIERFPPLKGEKSAWEIRLLSDAYGNKGAILNDKNFLEQHSDSHSTGLIELTKPPGKEPIVRDARSWNQTNPPFLKDVLESTLHYYFSNTHESTDRYKSGLNPPILSVIRFLTKAFQYELSFEPEVLEQLKSIVDKFKITDFADGSYVRNWIERNAKKLIQNAVNLEYATEVMDGLGLREKLCAGSDSTIIGSMSWWMNRAPLRSKPIGEGNGKTAQQLGLSKVAHETVDYHAYESITRSHTGLPNVLISRDGNAGENAAYGDGFYTRIGREGARNTGFTIRFELRPEAKEGTDFKVLPHNYVLILNKNALKVIPEQLVLSIEEYFDLLLNEAQIQRSDLAVVERLKRRVRGKFGLLTEDEYRRISKVLGDQLRVNKISRTALEEWFRLPMAHMYSDEILRNLLRIGGSNYFLGTEVFNQPQWANHSARKEVLAKTEEAKLFLDEAKKSTSWSVTKWVKEKPGVLNDVLIEMARIANEPHARELVVHVFTNPTLTSSRAAAHALIQRLNHQSNENLKVDIGTHLFAKAHMQEWRDVLDDFIAIAHERALIHLLDTTFSKPLPLATDDSLMKILMRLSNRSNPGLKQHIANRIFGLEHTGNWQNSFLRLIEIGDEPTLRSLIDRVFKAGQPIADETALIKMLNRLSPGSNTMLVDKTIDFLVSSKLAENWDTAMEHVIDLGNQVQLVRIIRGLLSKPQSEKKEAIALKIMSRLNPNSNPPIVDNLLNMVLSKKHATQWKSTFEAVVNKGNSGSLMILLRNFFATGHAAVKEHELELLLGRLNNESNHDLKSFIAVQLVKKNVGAEYDRVVAKLISVGDVTTLKTLIPWLKTDEHLASAINRLSKANHGSLLALAWAVLKDEAKAKDWALSRTAMKSVWGSAPDYVAPVASTGRTASNGGRASCDGLFSRWFGWGKKTH